MSLTETPANSADRIEIVGGLSSGLRTRSNPLALFGVPTTCPDRFLVLLIEDDGGQVVLWDGRCYSTAMIEAEVSASARNIRVLDRVAE